MLSASSRAPRWPEIHTFTSTRNSKCVTPNRSTVLKIDFHQQLLGRDGLAILHPDMHAVLKNLIGFLNQGVTFEALKEGVKALVPMTFADVCYEALNEPPDKPDAKEKMRRFRLGNDIFGSSGPIEVDHATCVMLATIIDLKFNSTLIVGLAGDILEPPESKEETP